jgi:hypothetical protein
MSLSTPQPPPPRPGWYPDPGGAHAHRYFDGQRWTDQLAPFSTSTPPPLRPARAAKPKRPFVILAIAGPVVGLVTFILMQLSFGAAADGSLLFNIIGFALFAVWLACILATLVGIVGVVVRLAQDG